MPYHYALIMLNYALAKKNAERNALGKVATLRMWSTPGFDNCWRHVPTHAAAAALVKWTLLPDFVQLHVDLFGDDGDRVAAESGHHHGAQVGDVVTLTEGGNTAAHALLRTVRSGEGGGEMKLRKWSECDRAAIHTYPTHQGRAKRTGFQRNRNVN